MIWLSRLSRSAARAAHYLARVCTRWAERLDPPATGDLDRMLEVMEHVKAGRIQKRRGETVQHFAQRLVRGDFEIYSNLIDFNVERAKRMQRALPTGALTKW